MVISSSHYSSTAIMSYYESGRYGCQVESKSSSSSPSYMSNSIPRRWSTSQISLHSTMSSLFASSILSSKFCLCFILIFTHLVITSHSEKISG
ncbi:hypothetical protein BLOT_007021 [Blomia tropicalis]|nr:hypothetical protein BLOT_007021 [Blomia tropicalis]